MKAFQSAIWDLSSRVANYIVAFVVSVIITRILTPEEFGAFGVILAIVAFSWVILDFGFRSAIVQAVDLSQTQLSTVFYLNLLFGSGLAVLLLIIGPSVERYFEIPGLAHYIAGISPIFIINGLFVVPSGLLQRNLKLKQMSIFSVLSTFAAGTVAISMAYSGFGVWSLIASSLISTFFTTVGCVLVAKWKPSVEFDLRSVKPLYDFGSRMFLSSLIDVTFSRADILFIGRIFDVTTLGYYTRAQSLDQQIRMFSVSTIVTVMLPLFARFQNDLVKLKEIYLRSLHFISFVTIALAGLFFLVATDLFLVLFTEKWVSSADYFRIMVITSATYPLSYLMLNLISGKGNSKALLRLEFLKKTILLPAYLTFFIGGIFTFLISMCAVYTFSLLINIWVVKDEIDIPLSRQISVIAMYAISAASCVLMTYLLIEFMPNTPVVRLLSSIILFGVIYLLLNRQLSTAGYTEFIYRVRSAIKLNGAASA